MGELMRSHDWSKTSIGLPATWPSALKTSLRLLLTSRHPMFIWWGPELLQFYNEAYRKTLGPERHPRALGQKAMECWEEVWHLIGPDIEFVMSGQGATWHEETLVPLTRHGKREDIWWTYGYSPIEDESGVLGVLVICNDVTGEHLHKETLKNSYYSLVQALDQGFCVIESLFDASGCAVDYRFLETNDAFEKQSGLRDAVGKTAKELVPELEGHWIETYGRVALTRNPIRFEEEAPSMGRWFDVYATPVGAADSRKVALLFTDITERRATQAKLQAADKRKDEFLAMLAHELRNPLAPIGAAAELLQIVKLDEQRVRQTSQIIDRQVKHMTSLIDDLLDVSRVTRGLVELDCERVDMNHVVTDAIEQVAPLIRTRNHHFTVLTSPDPKFIRGDRKRMVQVLANILNNAAKYTKEGGHITLHTDVSATAVVIDITDDGIGMAPELVTSAFDLFSQGERKVDRSSGGLGIGLALVKTLVELHGGSVRCESAVLGRGSKFIVSVPRFDDPENLLRDASNDASVDDGGGRLRVLVVDDNVDAAAMLAMLLEALGHEVSVEHDARRALAKAAAENPHICLIDIGLPEMNGNELARQLRAQPETAATVLVAVTGYGQDNDRRQSQLAGFDHHFVKPVDIKQLAVIFADVVPM